MISNKEVIEKYLQHMKHCKVKQITNLKNTRNERHAVYKFDIYDKKKKELQSFVFKEECYEYREMLNSDYVHRKDWGEQTPNNTNHPIKRSTIIIGNRKFSVSEFNSKIDFNTLKESQEKSILKMWNSEDEFRQEAFLLEFPEFKDRLNKVCATDCIGIHNYGKIDGKPVAVDVQNINKPFLHTDVKSIYECYGTKFIPIRKENKNQSIVTEVEGKNLISRV